jgi:hypothetical protein
MVEELVGSPFVFVLSYNVYLNAERMEIAESAERDVYGALLKISCA